MSLIIEKHLEGITVENYLDYKVETFTMYASARGVKLGFIGKSTYVVKSDGVTYSFKYPEAAIEKYKELLRE